MNNILTDRQKQKLAELMMKGVSHSIAQGETPIELPYHWVQSGDVDTILGNIERKQKRNEAVEEENRRVMVRKAFSREELFRLAYVPFVIAELVWDYADSVILLSGRIGNHATKHLSRAIREARAEYERVRYRFIDNEHREREIDNGFVFEEATKRITSQMMLNLKIDIECEYPGLGEDSRYLLCAVYQCHITSKALLKYLARQTARAEKRLGTRIGRMLPPSYYIMDRLIPEYIGDKPVSDSFRKLMEQYIEVLSVQMEIAELNDITENDNHNKE